MIIVRPFGGISAVFCLCLASTALAAPHKAAKSTAKHAATSSPAKTVGASSPMPASGDVILYSGRPADAEGLTLTSFGGGTVEDSTEQSFAKGHSLKVTTLDSYQGANLTFGTPVALGDLTDKTRYLDLTLRLSATGEGNEQPMPAPNGFPGGRGFPGRRGFPGGPEGGQGEQFGSEVAPEVQNVHLILTLANGVKTDVLRPLPTTGEAQSGVDQWVDVAVPLTALGFTAGTSSPLQNLKIAGDDYAVMYVGQIKLTQDDTPITAFAGDQQTVQVGQPFVLKGSASGGLTALHFAWTIDAAAGTPEQASGPVVTTQYLKPGDHTVTLTVSDIDGIKKPAVSTTIIHVQ